MAQLFCWYWSQALLLFQGGKYEQGSCRLSPYEQTCPCLHARLAGLPWSEATPGPPSSLFSPFLWCAPCIRPPLAAPPHVQIDLLEALYRCARAGALRDQHRAALGPDLASSAEGLAARKGGKELDLPTELRRLLVPYNRGLGREAS